MGDMIDKPMEVGDVKAPLPLAGGGVAAASFGSGPGFQWPMQPIDFSYGDEAVGVLPTKMADLKAAPAKELLEFGEKLFASASLPGLAFDRYRAGAFDQAVVLPELHKECVVWFIGDVHGDLLALEAALFHIGREQAKNGKGIVVFLGDLIDDNPDAYGVFLRVLSLIAANPSRVCLLAGNHDESLSHDGDTFTSSVDPGDFAIWLNHESRTQEERRAGKLFVRFFRDAPRALFFADGLVSAHGGIPHIDLQAAINLRADLNRQECIQDFVWTRASTRASKKIPNRLTRGCQFGYKDFDRFCEVSGNALGRPVLGMIRGHDHIDQRFDLHAPYANRRLLTLNTMGHRLSRESGSYPRTPCVARYLPGWGIEVHRINIPERLLRSVYPETPVA